MKAWLKEGITYSMEENNVTLAELVEAYDELDVSAKRKELGFEITELTIVVKKLLADIAGGFPGDIESLEEFENLYSGQTSEEQYLTGLYEDVLNFKEILGMYLDRVTSLYYMEEE